MAAVVVDNVTKVLGGRPVVDGLSMTVERATIHGFLGPNGSGKTTTLRMMTSILLPDSGRVEVLGDRSRGAARGRVGYLPEERGLYRKMGVRSLLLYLASLKGMARGDAGRSIDGWLDRFGLVDAAQKPVEALSKGMAQKAQFIAAVIGDPELLILDEPFTGLDPVNVDAMKAMLGELRAKGVAIVLCTHDMASAEDLCDHVSMVFGGKKLADGTLDEVLGLAGRDLVRVRIGSERTLLESMPEVESVKGEGGHLLVGLRVDGQAFLKSLVGRTEVFEFRLERPSLHEVFVKLAGKA